MAELPYLDIEATDFSTRSGSVLDARAQSWCARTPYGLAVLSYREAGLLLRDPRLRQGSHNWPDIVGLEGSFSIFWRHSVISMVGEEHKKLRRIAQSALSPGAIDSLIPSFHNLALALISDLSRDHAVDFLDQFSGPFASGAIAALLGAPTGATATMGQDASTLGLAMGLDAKSHEDEINAACDRLMHLANDLIDGDPATDFIARLKQAAEDEGPIDRQRLVDLVVITIFGGVDTTRAQLALAVYLLAEHHDQWLWLRSNREAVPSALDEAMRLHPTTTWVTREVVETFQFNGVAMEEGETVHIFVHAASTDPANGHDGHFDIREPRRLHFGFGGGAHHCLGHRVAKTDMSVALNVLLDHWARVTLDGEVRFLPATGNTAPARLWLSPVWA